MMHGNCFNQARVYKLFALHEYMTNLINQPNAMLAREKILMHLYICITNWWHMHTTHTHLRTRKSACTYCTSQKMATTNDIWETTHITVTCIHVHMRQHMNTFVLSADGAHYKLSDAKSTIQGSSPLMQFMCNLINNILMQLLMNLLKCNSSTTVALRQQAPHSYM